MTETTSNQIDELIRRLNEAERRAKLLNGEVKRIKLEIATIKNSVSSLPAEASSSTINGHITRRARSSTASGDAVDGSPPPQNKRSKLSFVEDDGYVTVFTDGACENNGRANAKAGIGVWFGPNNDLGPKLVCGLSGERLYCIKLSNEWAEQTHKMAQLPSIDLIINVSKPVVGRATNNTAEIQACIEALTVLESQGIYKVKIFTDSQFTINCITKWMKNWKRNNWKTSSGGPVKNKEDLIKLDEVIGRFLDVKWVHVNGHAGIKGNEEADKLATAGATKYQRS